MNKRHTLTSLIAIIVFGVAAVGRGDLIPAGLRCEYLENPIGIDAVQPRLSWELTDDDHVRGQKQTAYHLLVSSCPDKLAANEGDLWDSGKIESDKSIHVPYAGLPLVSHRAYWWKVRAWNGDGQPTPWSKPGTWTMSILNPADWGAKWLSHTRRTKRQLAEDDPARLLNFENCFWIWASDTQPLDSLPAGNRFFRKRIELPEDVTVDWAYLLLAADDRYRLFLNGGEPISISRDEPDAWREGYEIELTERLLPGPNVLAIQVNNRAPGPAGLAGKLIVRLGNGKTMVVPVDENWRASNRVERNWQQPEFDDTGWPAARVLAAVGDKPWGVPKTGYAVGWCQTAPSPLFRKTFTIGKPVRRATAYVTGLGYYEMRLNGDKVGDHVLDPAFTRYDKRVLYSTYDVTEKVRQGNNALAVMLGNGWYNMHTRATWNFDQSPWRGEPRMLLHLRVEQANGSVRTIVSDETWKASTGPIVLDSIRAGEVYDARLEMRGWDSAGFDDRNWASAKVAESPGGVLRAQMIPPLRVTKTIKPVLVREGRPGTFLYDLGQNIAGWIRLRVSGSAGTRVTLRYGERLCEDGSLDRDNISKFLFAGPFQQDTYILRGGGREIWEPRFVYHGFRYVEVKGFPGKPTLENTEGRVVHTDFEPAGQFRCSDELLNRIQSLTSWSFRGNFHGYPTDCPHREKNGWTGDAHLAAEQAMFNWQCASAYTKWVNDILDEQQDSGEIACINPTSGWGYRLNGPAWDSACVVIPWYVYLYRGDRRILETHYESMKCYVDFVASKSPGHIADFGLGDWMPANTSTPRDVTSTAYFYVDTLLVTRVAELLGRKEDAARYKELAGKIRAAFNQKYYLGDGRYANGSQTALSCALFQDLAEPAERRRVVARLVEAVHAREDHLDVGILGAKYLFNTLSDYGQHELACRIATRKTLPSYGHWIEQGATTLWEDWGGRRSRNHIAFGDISAWMYKYISGIRIDPRQPGFKHVTIHPLPPADMAWAEARHNSMYGPIRTRWERTSGSLVVQVSLPPNTTATVILPTVTLKGVTESGRPVAKSSGVKINKPGGRTVCVESGCYEFCVPEKTKP